MGDNPPIARLISQLAAGQQGNVARRQLLAAGLGSDAIDYRIEVAKLVVVFKGVYGVGYRQPTPISTAAAAVLAAGPHAVLSHESAAALWGLRKRWPSQPEVTLTRGDRRPKGIVVHRSTTLTRHDVTIHHGIRTTTAARTIADIASRHNDADLARAINDARRSGHLKPDALQALGGRSARLAEIIGTHENATRSRFEDAFLRFVKRYDLPEPVVNGRALGYEADIVFLRERVIVELDGYEFHWDRRTFVSDRERDTAALDHDHVTIRLTEERLVEPEAIRMRRILARRR